MSLGYERMMHLIWFMKKKKPKANGDLALGEGDWSWSIRVLARWGVSKQMSIVRPGKTAVSSISALWENRSAGY